MLTSWVLIVSMKTCLYCVYYYSTINNRKLFLIKLGYTVLDKRISAPVKKYQNTQNLCFMPMFCVQVIIFYRFFKNVEVSGYYGSIWAKKMFEYQFTFRKSWNRKIQHLMQVWKNKIYKQTLLLNKIYIDMAYA